MLLRLRLAPHRVTAACLLRAFTSPALAHSLYDVPGDELADGEGGRPLAVASHGAVVGLDLAQRLKGRGGAV